MTDVPDGSGPIRRPRVSDGGAPVSGALAMILAVVAVVAGFLILRSISDGGEQELDAPPSADVGNGGSGGDTAEATDGATDTTAAPTLPPTTTEPQIIVDGASVTVANANSQGGSAGAMTRALEAGPGFTMVDPVNGSESVGDIPESIIYFSTGNAAAKDVANSLGRVLGGVSSVEEMPDPPPTRDGTVNGADVLLMLGEDKANKTLDELNPESADDGATVVTNPPVAGDGTTGEGTADG